MITTADLSACLQQEADRQAERAVRIRDQVSRFLPPRGITFAVAIRPGNKVRVGLTHKRITAVYEVEQFTENTLHGLNVLAHALMLEFRGISDVRTKR